MNTPSTDERAILAHIANEESVDLTKMDDVRYGFTSSGHLIVNFYDHSGYFTVPHTYTFKISRI